MDFNITEIMSKGVTEGVVAGFIYDVISLAIAFILVKFFYEKLLMKLMWGHWYVLVFKPNKEGKKVLVAKRKVSLQTAKKIFEDEGEFSIYVKGVVSSTNTWLNEDVASENAKDIKLTRIFKNQRKIVIDLSKNPSKEKNIDKKETKIEFTKETQQQIDNIEKLLEELKTKK